jgi:hypothetical protein
VSANPGPDLSLSFSTPAGEVLAQDSPRGAYAHEPIPNGQVQHKQVMQRRGHSPAFEEHFYGCGDSPGRVDRYGSLVHVKSLDAMGYVRAKRALRIRCLSAAAKAGASEASLKKTPVRSGSPGHRGGWRGQQRRAGSRVQSAKKMPVCSGSGPQRWLEGAAKKSWLQGTKKMPVCSGSGPHE